ncbi:MAG: hypothetical protein MZV70_13000 [Desulfobacterales bacterium]|nr:hypothetical protein [Desulfobacterales bacterium]
MKEPLNTIAIEDRHTPLFHQAPPLHRARRGDLRLGRVGEALHRLHRRVGRHLPGARTPRHHRRPDRAGSEDHPEPELGAHLLACPRAAHRPAHGDPSFEPDAGLFRQQRRRGKRCRDQAGPEGHGPDGCRLDGAELSRPDDQHGLGHGSGQAPRALQPAHAQLHLRSLRRRRGHRRGAGREHGRRHPRAHPGGRGRQRAARRLPAGRGDALPKGGRLPDRRRGPDGLLPDRTPVCRHGVGCVQPDFMTLAKGIAGGSPSAPSPSPRTYRQNSRRATTAAPTAETPWAAPWPSCRNPAPDGQRHRAEREERRRADPRADASLERTLPGDDHGGAGAGAAAGHGDGRCGNGRADLQRGPEAGPHPQPDPGEGHPSLPGPQRDTRRSGDGPVDPGRGPRGGRDGRRRIIRGR